MEGFAGKLTSRLKTLETNSIIPQFDTIEAKLLVGLHSDSFSFIRNWNLTSAVAHPWNQHKR